MSKSFVEVARNWRRMCLSQDNCISCPCRMICLGKPRVSNAKNIEFVIEKWCEEHPEKTRLDDFIEKHPNAPIDYSGTPCACAGFCGYTTRDIEICDKKPCSLCWNEVVDE